MTVPNPTAAPGRLPPIRVHGATAWRRRTVVLGLAIVAMLVSAASAMVAPIAADGDWPASQVGAVVGAGAIWGSLVVRGWPPFAGIARHLVATLVALAWATAAAVVTAPRSGGQGWDAVGVVATIAAALVGLWLAWWGGGLRLGVVGPIVAPVTPRQSATVRSAWSGTSTGTAMLVMWCVLGVGLVALIVWGLPIVPSFAWMLVALLMAIVSIVPLALRVTADRRGLRITSRVLGIPLVRVPLDQVATVAAGEVDEADWTKGDSAVVDPELVAIVHRSGPALVVTRTDGSMVVVAIERADEAAATLVALRDAAVRERGSGAPASGS